MPNCKHRLIYWYRLLLRGPGGFISQRHVGGNVLAQRPWDFPPLGRYKQLQNPVESTMNVLRSQKLVVKVPPRYTARLLIPKDLYRLLCAIPRPNLQLLSMIKNFSICCATGLLTETMSHPEFQLLRLHKHSQSLIGFSCMDLCHLQGRRESRLLHQRME